MVSAASQAKSLNIQEAFSSVTESNGVDDFLHHPFVITNERDQEQTLETLSTIPSMGNVMLGTSCFFNLNAYVKRVQKQNQPYYLIILDRGSRVKNFWNKVEEVVTTSENRHDATDKIKELIHQNCELYFSGYPPEGTPESISHSYQERLQKEIDNDISWLSTDQSFEIVKSMMEEKRFLFKCVNLFNDKQVQNVQNIMKANNLAIDVLYLSNVENSVRVLNRHSQFARCVQILRNDSNLWMVHAVRQASQGAQNFCQNTLLLSDVIVGDGNRSKLVAN